MILKSGIMGILLCSISMLLGSWDIDATVQPNFDPKGRKYFEQRGEIIWEHPVKQKWIALTFDDGPDREITPQLLMLLRKYHVKATFFCMGSKVKRRPHMARQIIAQGHEIGNHTYHHKKIQYLSNKELNEEIALSQCITFQVTKHRPTLFRPPEGNYSSRVVKIAQRNKLQVILWGWDQDTRDWQNPSVNFIFNKVTKNASSGDIVLFHDTQRVTVKALEKILPALTKEGYRFVTVSQLLKNVKVKN